MSSNNLRLHDYQIVARDFLRNVSNAALFLDMLPIGLGKTAISLSALQPHHLPALVVAPKRVAEHVWPTEATLWRPDLHVRVAKGNPKARARALQDSKADVVALGRDNLRDALSTPRERPFRTLIIDELSGFKSRQSVRWRTARKLVQQPGMDHVWGLTGTPTPNGLMDLWAQVALLDGGQRLGRNITTYRSRYFTPGRQMPNGIITEWVPRPEAEAHIHRLISDVCLSMATDGRVHLPPVTYNTIEIDLPRPVRATYREMKDTLVADLRNVLGGEVHTAANAAILTSKLQQLTAGFMYVDDADLRDGQYTTVHSSKVDAVREVIEGTGSPVLVFYRFKAELQALQAALPQAATMREPGVIDRWNAGQVPVLLAHPASAGHGLNLQHGGHTIVWTTLPWSLEEWQQANKRLARQGQKNPVVVHTLQCKGTVDTAVRARLRDKTTVQDALLTYLEVPL